MLFVAPTARKAENDSATAVGGYAQLTRTNAKTLNAKCIDLTTAVIKIKTALGSNIAALYCTVSASQLWPEQAAVNDGTHFSDYGSYELAKWMAIKGFRSVNLPVTQYMVDSTDTFNVNAPENPTTWHIPFSIDTIYRHPATLVRPDIKDSAFSTVSIVNSVEALKLPEQSVGINMITHSISYVVTERGAAEFVIFSMSGQKLLQRKTALAAHAGTFQWNELGQLPVGSYILQMKVNNRESARTSFTKL
jgi:hypothetical protein